MHPRLADLPLPLAFAAALGLTAALPGQVIEWRFFKEVVYFQDAADTMPTTPEGFGAGALVLTAAAGDAGLITLSGGNLPGSVALEHAGGGEWFLELQYASQAAMNAEIPGNAIYTLTISGGTLGIQTQQVTVGPEQYPDTPYLTGASWANVQQLAPGVTNTLTWNHPGPLTQASGLTVLSVEDRAGNEVFASLVPGAQTSGTLPANTLNVDDCHYGWLEFTSDTVSPAGGFGVAGTVHHGRALDFEIRTWPFPTNGCAWHQTYGAGCANMELFSNDPILGTSWDLATFGISGTLAFTYFSFAPQEPGLPLSAFGLNAPGCTAYIDANSIVTNLGGLVLNGQLSLSIPLPAAQSFGGVLLYAQTIALTPLVPAGIGTSNLVEAMIGS